IADYIDQTVGPIPGAIILSAQKEADLQYNGQKKTIRFQKHPRAFLVLDGQHRVFGFSLAKTKNLRVPVVIYNDLSLQDETRLFIDINTKQRPVPTPLLLDIRRQAGIERRSEAHMRDVFDYFGRESDSALGGLLSAAKQVAGKISRPDFNKAYRPIQATFATSDPHEIYVILNAYLIACSEQLRSEGAADSLTNPVMFKALLQLFRHIAERVKYRYNGEFTAEHFNEILTPLFNRIPTKKLTHPPDKLKDLWRVFDRALISDLSIDTRTTSAAS
ncbi:MAG: DGQHR domain-containing protein, partial [Candidatus Binataceae bacterium]